MALRFGSNVYYYNKNLKDTIIGFLNLFTDIKVGKYDSETSLFEGTFPVGILFGPIERSSYINSEGQSVNRIVQLPLLHVELTGLEKDKTRAFAMKTLHVMGPRSGIQKNTVMAVPYNFTIVMTIFDKYEENIMQLIEQIEPIFNYHIVYYRKHPIFPEEITLSNWVSISSPPSFAFNSEYSADDRRGILAVPIMFTIEGWFVREAYTGYGVVKEIIANFKDYSTLAGMSKIRLLADPTIRDVIYTVTGSYTPSIGQTLTGASYSAIIVDAISGYSGYSSYYASGANSGWSGYSNGHVIVKFNSEIGVFLKNESLRVGTSGVGTAVSCEPYEPFKEADYGWSGYSGVSAVSGWSMYSGLSGYSSYSIFPGYSGYSEIKTNGYSGI